MSAQDKFKKYQKDQREVFDAIIMEDEHGYGVSNYSSASRIVPDVGVA